MRSEQVRAVLRARTPWEALDLGTALARHHAGATAKAWLVTGALPLVLLWTVLGFWPLLAWLVGWWLRPLFGRGPLHVLSRALFGHQLGGRRALAGLLLPWRHHGPWMLTLGRFSTTRGLDMPVAQLEAQRGRAAWRRKRVLRGGVGAVAGMYGLLCLGLELFIFIGIATAMLLVTPESPVFDVDVLLEGLFEPWLLSPAEAVGVALASVISTSVAETIYVVGCFGLYIQRRTQLEGWDVELAFRALAARLDARRVGRNAVVAALLMVLFAGGAVPSARAEAPPRDPVQVAAEVLSEPEFGGTETRTGWKWRWETAEREPTEQRSEGPTMSVGGSIEGLAWVLAGLALALLVVGLLRWTAGDAPVLGERPALPGVRTGRDEGPGLRPSLDDLPGRAWALWQQGGGAAALGLLYQGTVAWLVQRHGVELVDGSTERECVRKARPVLAPPQHAFLRELTRTWSAAAYAHRLPDDAAVQALCHGWRSHFGAGDP